MAMKGMIFDIKKFAVHDGPGIRSTVFFKGCPLRCLWCHNPEGISPAREIMVFSGRCLKGCRDCLAVCPRGALDKRRGAIVLDRSRCDGCGACADACAAEALQATGREMSVSAVLDELARDAPFYRESGGGATFSGGEPLQQPEFLRELLRACRGEKISTVVDTSGQAPYSDFASILPLADLFLFDLKIVDDARHLTPDRRLQPPVAGEPANAFPSRRAAGRPPAAGPRLQRRDSRPGAGWPTFAPPCPGATRSIFSRITAAIPASSNAWAATRRSTPLCPPRRRTWSRPPIFFAPVT